ncbi:MAG: tetratricopeptide (TPR) repeat protein [Myxococcota bacterium]|jgi:tetratricopeptide (TPR) repeat protein
MARAPLVVISALLLASPAVAQRVQQSLPMEDFQAAIPLARDGARMLKRGQSREGRKLLNKARTRLLSALDREPGFVKAGVLLGRVLLHLERHEEAAFRLKIATAASPDAWRLRHSLGIHLFRLGKNADGARVLESVVASTNDDIYDVHYLLLGHYYRARKDARATRHARAYLKSRPDDPQVHGVLGNVHLRNGRVEEAVTSFRKVLSLAPDNIPVRVNLGNVYFQRRDYHKAAAIYEAVLDKRPGLALVHFNAGSCYHALTQWPRAASHFESFIELEPRKADGHYFAGVARAELGEDSRAVQHLQAATRLGPADARPHFRLAGLALKNSNLPAAGTHAEAAVKRAPRMVPYLALAGRLARRLGDPRRAIGHLSLAARLEPKDAELRAGLGRARLAAGAEDAGIDDLEAARTIAQSSPGAATWLAPARTRRGVDRVERGDDAGAEADFSRALEVRPDQVEAAWNLALLLDRSQRAPEALRVVKAAMQTAPTDAELHLLAAWLLVRQGEVERAQRALERASGAREVGMRWLVQGAIHGHFGEFEAAIGAFERAAENGADAGDALTAARLDRAAELLQRKQAPAALAALKRIGSSLDQGLGRIATGIALVAQLELRGDLTPVGALLDRFLTGPIPSGWGLETLARDARLLRGYLAYRAGDERKAVTHLEAYRKAQPDDERGSRLLAAALTELAEREHASRRWSEAEQLAQRAREVFSSPRLEHNLACVQYSRGDHQGAARVFERLETDGAVSEATLNLALFLDDVKGAVERPLDLYRSYVARQGIAAEIARRRIVRKERIFHGK